MKAPITWLKDYVDIDLSPKELSEKLLSAGFEVEEIIYKGEGIENVVVGKIVSIEKHENADKLKVCQIDVGKGEPLQIVTGAGNVSVGDFVPVALDGANLPNGKQIFNGELRGVKSYGMLCSGSELCLTDADYPGAGVNGIMLLRGNVKVGENIVSALGLDEYILDISITANRPDCQGVLGIAREIAAILNKPLKMPKTSYKETGADINTMLKVLNNSDGLCPKYSAAIAYDIKIQPSSEYIAKRLRLSGLRPINNIVDITNFVLLEVAQPMHAFDYTKVDGKLIDVRRAKSGEKLIALNEKEYELPADALVISNASEGMAIAGIMGGLHNSISTGTNQIVFESAIFARQSIRKNSKKLGLRSDSSAMYEKGVSEYSCDFGMKRALSLIDEFGYGRVCKGIIAVKDFESEQKVMEVEAEKIDDILGIRIDRAKMLEILNRLSIETTIANDKLVCKIPSYRTDMDRYPDIAEEIIRLYGYDNISGTMLKNSSITNGKYTARQKNVLTVEEAMTRNGFSEAITYSFIGQTAYDNVLSESDGSIKLMNPLGEEVSLMRTQLCSSMMNIAASNFKKGNGELRLFELASVYMPKELPLSELPNERLKLSIAAYGDDEDFFTIKGGAQSVFDALRIEVSYEKSVKPHMHPGRCADIIYNGGAVGYLGEMMDDIMDKYDVSKRVYYAEIDLEDIIGNAPRNIKYRDIPRFMGTYRDLALVVGSDITHESIMKVINENGGEYLESVELFDIYVGDKVGKGMKSMAYKLRFRAGDRTLTDGDVQAVIDKLLLELKTELGVTLR